MNASIYLPIIFGTITTIATIVAIGSSFQTRRSAIQREIDIKRHSDEREAFLIADSLYKQANERRFSILETNWGLFTRVIEKDLGNMLHSPHRKELDELIEKNERDELTRDEALEFAKILDETLHDTKLRPGEEVGIKLFKASIIARFRLMELL